MEPEYADKEVVVLLHGILRTRRTMQLLNYYLRKKGYYVLNITYPSNKHTLQELTDFLHSELSTRDAFNKASKVHFVTHSMGGILTRYYLSKHKPANLGRVVMMGPPNQGSEFADFMSEKRALRKIFKKLFGPAGQQLRVAHKHEDDDIDYEVGVIAGDLNINPLAPYVLRREKSDGIVAVERTKIEGMKDHVVVKSTHSFMIFNPAVLRQIDHFLKHGVFHRKPSP